MEKIDPFWVYFDKDASVYNQEEVQAAEDVKDQFLSNIPAEYLRKPGYRFSFFIVNSIHLHEDIKEDDDVRPVEYKGDLFVVVRIQSDADTEWLGQSSLPSQTFG